MKISAKAGKAAKEARMVAIAKQRAAAAPRDRLLVAAAELFYNDGIRATGVDAIASHAATTKMALYRHFQSKDALVTEWLEGVVASYWAAFDHIEADAGGDARAEIIGWASFVGSEVASWSHRGCPFMNSIAELPDRQHPARQLIEAHKANQIRRLALLCAKAGAVNPDKTASEIMFLLEGAQVSAQNMSVSDIGERLQEIVTAILDREAAQIPKRARSQKK
jgi:AcrR family transcriptional regulator